MPASNLKMGDMGTNLSDEILPNMLALSLNIEDIDHGLSKDILHILGDFLKLTSRLTMENIACAALVLLGNTPHPSNVCAFDAMCVTIAEQIPYHYPSNSS